MIWRSPFLARDVAVFIHETKSVFSCSVHQQRNNGSD
jgi:hypothetical protein